MRCVTVPLNQYDDDDDDGGGGGGDQFFTVDLYTMGHA